MSMLSQADPMIQHMIGAARLEASAYEAVEKDKKATGQAAYIVVATSLVAGGVSWLTTGEGGGGILDSIVALIGWAFYAQLAYLLGTKVFPAKGTKADWGEVARALGFANTPRFLMLLAVIPGIAGTVRSAVELWVLVATIVALRSALDCSTGRAIAVGIAAWLAQILILVIAFVLFANAV
ncbi:MAG TPA: YIP1 family protein [Candidatus Limnocylindria bacterium]|nr:YIP1 family protein [Candidatus Limnocylindria bacterium]